MLKSTGHTNGRKYSRRQIYVVHGAVSLFRHTLSRELSPPGVEFNFLHIHRSERQAYRTAQQQTLYAYTLVPWSIATATFASRLALVGLRLLLLLRHGLPISFHYPEW